MRVGRTIYGRNWPAVPWREPIKVKRTDGVERWGCRLCIAAHGLLGRDIDKLWETFDEVLEHIEERH